jgi:hypothetical protein
VIEPVLANIVNIEPDPDPLLLKKLLNVLIYFSFFYTIIQLLLLEYNRPKDAPFILTYRFCANPIIVWPLEYATIKLFVLKVYLSSTNVTLLPKDGEAGNVTVKLPDEVSATILSPIFAL